MPKYRRKRKPYRRRRRKYSKQLSLRQSPMPNRFVTKLVYAEQVSLDASAATPDYYVFNASSVYDCNTTGVGHQARGFDELMAMYDHFVVLGAKITVRAFNNDAINSQILSITLKDNSTAVGAVNNYLEDGHTKYQIMGTSESSASTAVLTHTYSPKRFLGRTAVLADPDLKGTNASNPTENAFFHIGVNGTSQADNPSAVDLFVRIEYITCFIEPKTPSQS